MWSALRFFCLALLLIGSCLVTESARAASNPHNPSSLLGSAQRLIVVTTPSWNSVDGSLTRYERSGTHWKKIAEPIAIVVGKSGMGWDSELAGSHGKQFPGPVKHEGDGRAPAGIFSLARTFGYANAASTHNYLPLTSTIECVDDERSANYNRILDRATIAKVDWSSSEQMRRSDDLYKWGVVIAHNPDGTPGNGSCIFLHVWSGPSHGTAGCTAMPEDEMKNIVDWVNASRTTVLVQLPEAEYLRLRKLWRLP